MISGSGLQAGIESALRVVDVDYEKVIAEFGQAAACAARAAGRRFPLQEHVRGLVLAQLSNQRRWGLIAENLEAISNVFRGFHPDSLIDADLEELSESL